LYNKTGYIDWGTLTVINTFSFGYIVKTWLGLFMLTNVSIIFCNFKQNITCSTIPISDFYFSQHFEQYFYDKYKQQNKIWSNF
jgi:hypothetical protein